MSAAQWRYCVWAAARLGALTAMQLRVTGSSKVREAIYQDLRRRIGRVASGLWTIASFVPRMKQPDNALCRLRMSELPERPAVFPISS